jgi:vacuolar-type H+-ATPase subunit E/Vma4
MPVELRVDQNGLRLDAEELRRRAQDEAATRLRQAREQAQQRQAEARQTFEEQMRMRVDEQGDLVERPPGQR